MQINIQTYAAVKGTLIPPSSRVVKDSTPSRHRILRCINFGIGGSLANLFLNMVNLYLVKIEAQWILNERAFYCFIIFFIWKWILTLKKNQFGESSPNLIFVAVNLDPIVKEKKRTDGESWPNVNVEKVNRGEGLRWLGSRCPLTSAKGVTTGALFPYVIGVYCYLEFKLCFFLNLKLFATKVKDLFEPIVFAENNRRYFALRKIFMFVCFCFLVCFFVCFCFLCLFCVVVCFAFFFFFVFCFWDNSMITLVDFPVKNATILY